MARGQTQAPSAPLKGYEMLLGEVLNVQGRVQVTDARGRQRFLLRGEHLQPGDKLDLDEGATLLLRHPDGQEEVLHGAAPSPDVTAFPVDPLVLPGSSPGQEGARVREREEVPPLLLSEIQPEAGILQAGELEGGHRFVRVERVQPVVPHSPLALSPCCGPLAASASTVPVQAAALDSALALARHERATMEPEVLPWKEDIYFSDLLEGAGFLQPNSTRTEIVIRTLASPLPFVDQNGNTLLAHYSSVQAYSRLDLTLLRQEQDLDGAARYVYEVRQQTLGESMPNIPFRQVESEQETLLRPDGSRVVFVSRITGMVDRAPDQLITILEPDDPAPSLIDISVEVVPHAPLMPGLVIQSGACPDQQEKETFSPVDMLDSALFDPASDSPYRSLEPYLSA